MCFSIGFQSLLLCIPTSEKIFSSVYPHIRSKSLRGCFLLSHFRDSESIAEGSFNIKSVSNYSKIRDMVIASIIINVINTKPFSYWFNKGFDNQSMNRYRFSNSGSIKSDPFIAILFRFNGNCSTRNRPINIPRVRNEIESLISNNIFPYFFHGSGISMRAI